MWKTKVRGKKKVDRSMAVINMQQMSGYENVRNLLLDQHEVGEGELCHG